MITSILSERKKKMNNSKTEDMVTNVLLVLTITGVLPFLASALLIGLVGLIL